jgi:signal peptidase I
MQLAFWKKGKDNTAKKKKPVWREWLDAAVFAIVAATIIRTFFIEAYTIPTPSMEGSMLVNDFLFVSKTAYGPRIPNTPIAFPLVHNTMPITGGKSYTESVQWSYKRLPGFGKVERNDVVVFNFPNGDTVVAEKADRDYYEICRNEGGREAVHNMYTIITRPVDKKENYIKRCIGIPGDKIQIVDGIVYLNNQKGEIFPHSQLHYIVETKGTGFSEEFLEENKIQPLKVFPNPANEQISFEVLSDELLQSPFEITDMQGKNYLSSMVYSSNFSISTSHFPSGVYFYKILHSSGKVYRGKFIKGN